MDRTARGLAGERLDDFFAGIAGLSGDQVRRLRQVPRTRTVTHLALELHPDHLDAVSAGRWTRDHDLLVAEARRRAKTAACHLAPRGRRGALAKVLENAAMVVVTDTDPDTVLSHELRHRLVAPWEHATGVSASRGRFAAA